MKIARISAVTVVVCSVAVATACSPRVDNATHAEALRELVSGTPEWVDSTPLGRRLWKMEQEFYASRGSMPAWVDGVETTAQWKDLVQELKYAEAHGLDPAAYGVADFEALREQSQDRWSGTKFPAERVPELDARMTYAYLRYAADLLGWTRSPREVHRNWLADPNEEDLAARLTQALQTQSIRASLEELAPTHSQYKGLQAALAREAQTPTGRAR
jgi:murein L,D-transpeptidase YcbB/YkuD